MTADAVLREHVERFNAGVRGGDFTPMVDELDPDAEMTFVGVAAGPFVGRDEIARAYREQPPDDEIVLVEPMTTVGDGATVTCPYAWKTAGGRAGDLTATIKEGRIMRLTISFDEQS